jgi:hypothetical protein
MDGFLSVMRDFLLRIIPQIRGFVNDYPPFDPLDGGLLRRACAAFEGLAPDLQRKAEFIP